MDKVVSSLLQVIEGVKAKVTGLTPVIFTKNLTNRVSHYSLI